MSTIIKKIFDQHGGEIGAILSANLTIATNVHQKNEIESKLLEYAYDILYPNEKLNIYLEMYIEKASVVVFRDFNEMPNL